MQVLVTGAQGFLGKYICKNLSKTMDVIETDINDMDITDSKTVNKRFSSFNPNFLVHLAAISDAQNSLDDPPRYFEDNYLGTLNLLEACRNNGIQRFVFMSSLTVYGRSASEVDENDSICPQHPYSGSKAACEILVRTYNKAFNIPAVILRPNLISGPGNNPNDLIFSFVNEITKSGKVEIFGSGLHQRQWTHPDDVALAVRDALLMINEDFHIINLGSNKMTVRDLAKTVVLELGKGEISYSDKSRQAFSLVCSTKKAELVLGWRPQIGIKEIIRQHANNLKKSET